MSQDDLVAHAKQIYPPQRNQRNVRRRILTDAELRLATDMHVATAALLHYASTAEIANETIHERFVRLGHARSLAQSVIQSMERVIRCAHRGIQPRPNEIPVTPIDLQGFDDDDPPPF